MELGRYETPAELQDEDKIFIFTKKQVGLGSVVIILGIGIIALFVSLHMAIIGIVLGMIVIVVGVFSVLFKIPEDKYLFGTGNTIMSIGYRIIRRRIGKNRCIYVRNGYRK